MAEMVPRFVRSRSPAVTEPIESREPMSTGRRRGFMLIRLFSLAILLVACTPGGIPTPSVELGRLEIVVVAGPVCPVEQVPPDPSCEPRPVTDARILVQPADGRDIVVGEGTTDEQGQVTIGLPAGDYLVAGAEVEGLMGVPELASVTVVAGETVTLSLGYDTGIR